MNSDSSSGSKVQRLRERQKEAIAQEILSAAAKEIVEKGIHSMHMADVAARAGVAVGTLYNHYKDRDALLCALAALRHSELLKSLDERIAAVENEPFRLQIRALLLGIFSHFEENWQFFAAFMQAESAPPVIARPAHSFQRAMYERFDALIERGKQQQVLRAEVAALAPSLLMGMTRAMLMRRLYVKDEPNLLSHVDILVDCFLDGVGRKKT
ncbi:MAG: TetR/AcrR family transcriptional regulator [Polyangia bacterium]|mgnify:CR=1 FL=1|jgi:AcrR family transcriptional regulator